MTDYLRLQARADQTEAAVVAATAEAAAADTRLAATLCQWAAARDALAEADAAGARLYGALREAAAIRAALDEAKAAARLRSRNYLAMTTTRGPA